MREFFSKSMYIGLGLANMTKEKIENFAKEIAKQSEMSETEGHKFVEYLQGESQKARTELNKTVESVVQAAIKRMPCMAKISALEERVAALEAAAGIAQDSTCACQPSPEATSPQPEAEAEKTADTPQ
jgi:polyhydroxyalkanoate synthesis regulator phasin